MISKTKAPYHDSFHVEELFANLPAAVLIPRYCFTNTVSQLSSLSSIASRLSRNNFVIW